MPFSRRTFIKTTAGSLAFAAITGEVTGCNTASGFPNDKFGLQLWTVRDEMAKDAANTLKQVSSFGYKQVESFEGGNGIFWGMKNTDFKKYIDDLGMTIISSHCNIDKDFEQKANDASAIGMKYLIAPYLGPQKTLDDYKKAADKFNERGETCKKAGIRFAYHNHDYSFTKQDGQFPQDIFLQNTNQDLVDFEMDIYWVVTAGQDPIAWMEKYPKRFRLSHIKDRTKNAPSADKDASCIVGQGEIDFAKILKAGQQNGLEYYIVEQEKYENSTPLLSAKADSAYLKQFKF